MADVLALLREYNINNRSYQELKDEIIFGDFAWPKLTKTNYVICGSGKEGQAKDYYTLESIVYFLKHVELPHTQYVRLAASAGLTMVRLPDRRDLLAYLKGEKTFSTSIDRSAPMDISLRRNVSEAHRDYGSRDEPEIKRSRYTEEIDASADQSLFEHDHSKTLPETIPLDKLKQIRAKIKANRQIPQPNESAQNDQSQVLRSFSIHDESLGHNSSSVRMPRMIAYMDANSKLSLIASDEKSVKSITSREVRWRNRATVLQSNAKTFYDNIVLGILRNVMLKENGPDFHMVGVRTMQNSGQIYGHVGSNSGGYLPGSSMVHSTANPGVTQQQGPLMQYSRYDQEKFAGLQEDTAGFAIDTMATYHRRGLASMVAAGSNNEPISDPRSKMVPTSRDPRSNIAPGSTPDPYRSVRSANESRIIARAKSRFSRVPIIVIPATPTSLITMLNARDVLQEMNFVPPNQKAGAKRETEITIHYKRGDGKSVPYRVVDQPNRLNADEWDRVVAVFVQGQAWQFKGWPIGSDPAVLFANIKGFNLKYSHQPTDANVAKWNVKVISLDLRKRHMDKASLQLMWDQIERHVAKTKPQLRAPANA